MIHIPCEISLATQSDATQSQDRPDAPAPFEPFLTCHFNSAMIGLNLYVHFHCLQANLSGAKPRTTIPATEKNTSHFVGHGLGCLCPTVRRVRWLVHAQVD